MKVSDEENWWRVDCRAQSAEDAAALLIAHGASGAQQINRSRFQFFFRGSKLRLESMLSELPQNMIEVISIAYVADENWHESCAGLWEPLQIGALKIVPLGSLSDRRSTSGTIFIVPGMGFGTGHHGSTNSVIELMQHDLIRANPPQRALDVGTGSGILSLALAKLYGCRILAVDNDPDALANAAHNMQINGLQNLIALSDQSLDAITEPFDLIVANIYAEVLCAMEMDLRRLAAGGAKLVISGIMPERMPDIERSFLAGCWREIKQRESGGWHSLLLERGTEKQ